MSQLSDPAFVRGLLARHDLRLAKSMGQNFLINPSVCPRMAQACGAGQGRGVIEIGPGIGVLTWELAQAAEKVVAIELDQRLFPVLEETLADCPNVELVQGDVLKLDLAALIAERFEGGPVCVCANLPYYITSPVIMGLLEAGLPLTAITVRGRPAALRPAGGAGLRSGQRQRALPLPAPGALPGGPGELSAAAQGGLRRDPPGHAAPAPRCGGRPGPALPDSPGGFCPAAQNSRKLPLGQPGPAQAPGGTGVGRSGASPGRAGRAADLGAVRRAGQSTGKTRKGGMKT